MYCLCKSLVVFYVSSVYSAGSGSPTPVYHLQNSCSPSVYHLTTCLPFVKQLEGKQLSLNQNRQYTNYLRVFWDRSWRRYPAIGTPLLSCACKFPLQQHPNNSNANKKNLLKDTKVGMPEYVRSLPLVSRAFRRRWHVWWIKYVTLALDWCLPIPSTKEANI